MRRYTLLIITLLALLGISQSLSAQQTQDALYIFRNDGGFNAFFYADIDHIEYSKTDTLGVEQDEYVVQEVYALDSIYRIPLSAIDSVAFVTPGNIVKSDVMVMTKSLTDYVVASDSVSWFQLAANTPESILPKIGDKLLLEDATDYLPDGFSGQVTSVDKTANGYIVRTDAVGLLDLFDRYVAKTAGQGKAPNSQVRNRGLFDFDIPTHIDDSYQTAEPIILPPLTGNINLTSSGEFLSKMGGNLSGSVDGVGTYTYAFQPKIDIRLFLYADITNGIKYHQEFRWSGDENNTLNIAGIATGHLDIPATFPADVTKTMAKVTLKKAGKELIKKLGKFDVALSFGGFLEAQGSVNISWTTQRTNARHFDVLDYTQSNYQLPGTGEFNHRSASRSERDTTMFDGWAGKVTFNMGAYAKAFIQVSFMKRVWEVGARIEGGVRLEQDPAIGPELVYNTRLHDTGELYKQLNREDDIHLNLFANFQLYAKLGWLTPVNFKPEITTNRMGIFGFVPNIERIQWNIDKKQPWQGTLTSPIRRDLLFPVPIGFAVFDENQKQVADRWYHSKYNYESVISLYQNTFDKLETGKTYTASPQIMIYGIPILTDQSVEFTLGPAYIDIDPDKQELTDYTKRILEFDEYTPFKDVTLLTNVANTEIEIPADAKWISLWWHKDEATVTFSPQTLPDDLDRREATVRIIGRDSTGTKILAQDSIIVRQVRPYIRAIPSPVEFDAKGGTTTVTLETSLDELTARVLPEANPDNFCSIKQEQDKDGKWTIEVKAAENKNAEDRTATIVVDGKSAGGQKGQLVFYVNQKGTGEEPGEEPSAELPATDELLGTPYPNINFVSCRVTLTRKGAARRLDLQNDYFNGVDGNAKASIDGRYIYVLSTSGSKEKGDSMSIYLKIDNESIYKSIVGGRIFMQDENEYFGETVCMTLGKMPNSFHNRRYIQYDVRADEDYADYDPEGIMGMSYGPLTGAGLAKFVTAMSGRAWNKDNMNTIREAIYTLNDEELDWRIHIDVRQYKDLDDNEYDNDHKDVDYAAVFPPQKMVEELKEKGMVIHTGAQPPAVSGIFAMTPNEVIGHKGYDSQEKRGTLQELAPAANYIKLSGLEGNRIMFDYLNDYYTNPFHQEAYPVAIQGSGNKFTISYIVKSWSGATMRIFSGEVDGKNLKNVYGASVVIKEDFSIKTALIYKESDGVSDAVEAADWDALVKVMKGE